MDILTSILAASYVTFVVLNLFRSHKRELATGDAGHEYWVALGAILTVGPALVYYSEIEWVFSLMCQILGLFFTASVVAFVLPDLRRWKERRRSARPLKRFGL